MTYEELVKKLKVNFEGMDAGKIKEHLAIQFNVAGEAEGALYMEIRDGKVMIEPYEYYDRDILVFVETDALLAIADSELTIYEAFKEGKFYAEGNLGKVELLDALSKKAAEQKAYLEEVKAEVAEKNESAEEKMESVVEVKEKVEEKTETVDEAKEEVSQNVEVKESVKKEEKKVIGRKVPSRKLKKAAAKKNARKNAAKK